MKCAYCNCLDDKNKKEGCTSGCLYYCKVKKEYIYANNMQCDHFKKSSRDEELVNNLIEESKVYDNILISEDSLLLLFVILVIIGLIIGVFR